MMTVQVPAGLLSGFVSVSLVSSPSLAKSVLGRCSDDVDCDCAAATALTRCTDCMHVNGDCASAGWSAEWLCVCVTGHAAVAHGSAKARSSFSLTTTANGGTGFRNGVLQCIRV